MSFDSSARIFISKDKNYFVPSESAGTNFNALFTFNCWLESQNFDSIEEVTGEFY